MKSFYFIICLTLVSGFAFPQWIEQNPLPTGNCLNSVCFTDSNTGFAVGELGTLLKTTDGGISWTILPSGTESHLNSVYFVDASTGFAVGGSESDRENDARNGIILKTTNGGTTWTTLWSHPTSYLKSVFFTNANIGYAVGGYYFGSKGIVLKTTDGGITWETLLLEPNYALISIFFTETNTGYTVGRGNEFGIILKTTDGGTTWTTISKGILDDLNSVFFANDKTGYAVGGNFWNSGIILKTIDSGANWDTLSLIPGYTLFSVFFTEANVGYVTAGSGDETGILLKTIDGGATWEKVCTTSSWLNSVYFTDASTGYAVGGYYYGSKGIVLKTTDGGATWLDLSRGPKDDLYSVFFPDTNNGYVVGENGTILKTSNGGTTWTTLSSETNVNLHSLFFTTVDMGYAVGDYSDENGSYSVIIKTADGGSSWNEVYSETNAFKGFPLSSIYFTNDNKGFAVGIPGKILKTIDGGTTWTSSALDWLIQIFFTDGNTGYAYKNFHDDPPNGGSSSVIEKTIDGGTSWNEIWWSGLQYKLHSIYFTNIDTGYAVGYHYDENGMYGIIIKTIDGGKSWTTSWHSGGGFCDSFLSSIYFTDVNTGYAIGGEWKNCIPGYITPFSAFIIKTTDGGSTWSKLLVGKSSVLNSVFFTDANTGYLVGNGGTILKTTNGGGLVSAAETRKLESTISVYPNPAKDFVVFDLPNGSESATVELYDIQGKKVIQQKLTETKQISVGHLPRGLYLYRLTDSKKFYAGKLVVE
jgi:photosystem II stability/assembly factor-like uncharacterized protein